METAFWIGLMLIVLFFCQGGRLYTIAAIVQKIKDRLNENKP